jgi:hypothetical protein
MASVTQRVDGGSRPGLINVHMGVTDHLGQHQLCIVTSSVFDLRLWLLLHLINVASIHFGTQDSGFLFPEAQVGVGWGVGLLT